MSLSYAEMEKHLMDELRLYHHPVAIKFFFDDESLEEFKAKANYSTPVKPLTFCQWEIAARMQRKTVLSTIEGLGCSNAIYNFGWKDLDDGEIKGHKKYFRSLEQAERFVKTKPKLPRGTLKAIATGPLSQSVLPPDVVHFYCDNMQSYHLSCDYMAALDTFPLRPAVWSNSAACGGAVYAFNEKTFNMGPACSGSYNAGKTERGELNVFIPGEHIEAVVLRLLERIDQMGSSAITRPGDAFPGGDICKNCPIIIFKAEK